MDTFYIIFCLLSYISAGLAIECFVCAEQEENTEKCIKTVRQCEEQEDTCITYVRWGITTFYTPAGKRQHFISKSCASKEFCQKQLKEIDQRCSREEYNDWACVECCQGDRCNYYVTLGAGSIEKSSFTMIFGLLLGLLVWLRLN